MNVFDYVVIQPIFNLLLGLYSIIPWNDFGVALILFTVMVRFAMWPLVKKQLHQTKLMRKIQPELAKIKKESGGNRQLESARMLELYKKHDVNPFRSFGILFIQIPVFLALYRVISILTSHRAEVDVYAYDFMKNISAVHNIIADPANFNEKLFGFLDLTKAAVSPAGINFILLALAIGAAYTQRIMTKQTMPKSDGKRLRDILTEASGGKQASQSEINTAVMGKMQNFLPIMMFFIMIGLPGALALYYAVSNMVAVVQQRAVFGEDVEEMEVIAEKEPKKKTAVKDREKSAKEAHITRIVAKENRRK